MLSIVPDVFFELIQIRNALVFIFEIGIFVGIIVIGMVMVSSSSTE